MLTKIYIPKKKYIYKCIAVTPGSKRGGMATCVVMTTIFLRKYLLVFCNNEGVVF